MITRYGGDEFIILFAGSDLQGVLALAQKIRTSLKSLEFNIEESTLSG